MPLKKSSPPPATKIKRTDQQHPASKQPSSTASNSHEIKALIQELRRSNSLEQKFISALITGFGTVIGATLLVALLIFLLSKLATIESLKPFVEQIVDIVKNAKK